MFALQASDSLYCVPINLMVLLHVSLIKMLHFIMTEATGEELFADRTLFLAASSIMTTAK